MVKAMIIAVITAMKTRLRKTVDLWNCNLMKKSVEQLNSKVQYV